MTYLADAGNDSCSSFYGGEQWWYKPNRTHTYQRLTDVVSATHRGDGQHHSAWALPYSASDLWHGICGGDRGCGSRLFAVLVVYLRMLQLLAARLHFYDWSFAADLKWPCVEAKSATSEPAAHSLTSATGVLRLLRMWDRSSLHLADHAGSGEDRSAFCFLFFDAV